jgi:cyclase
MLKVRLIPMILLRDGRAVKGTRFAQHRDVGNPVQNAKIYDAQGADELVFFDTAASTEGRGTLLDIVSATAEQCFMPLTVGGGVRSVQDIRNLLLAGADKVSLNTAAVDDPSLIKEAADRFGDQCVVVAIDVRAIDGRRHVVTNSGQNVRELDPVAWACEVADRGAGEIIVTSIDREGTRGGYDIPLLRAIADAVPVPVVASGGVGTLQDLVDGITEGHASAVSAGTIFHFTDQSLIKARAFMRTRGLDVRLG